MGESGRLRTKKIAVWVSADELRFIQDAARHLGISISDYIRRQALDGLIINYQVRGLREVTKELSAIGSNINQITRHANAIGSIPPSDFHELKELYDQLFDLYVSFAAGDIGKTARAAGRRGG